MEKKIFKASATNYSLKMFACLFCIAIFSLYFVLPIRPEMGEETSGRLWFILEMLKYDIFYYPFMAMVVGLIVLMVYLMVVSTIFYYKHKDNVLEIGEDYLSIKTLRVSIEKIEFKDIEFISTEYQRICIHLKNPMEYLSRLNLGQGKINRILKSGKKYGHVFIMDKEIDANKEYIMTLLFECWQKGRQEEN